MDRSYAHTTRHTKKSNIDGITTQESPPQQQHQGGGRGDDDDDDDDDDDATGRTGRTQTRDGGSNWMAIFRTRDTTINQTNTVYEQ